MAMSGKGLSKEAFSLCSLKGQKQQNSFQRMKKIISSFLSFLLFSVLSTSLDSYGQNNLEDLSAFIISFWQLSNSLCLPYSFPLHFWYSLIIHLYSLGLTTVSTVTEISRSCISLLPSHASCSVSLSLILEHPGNRKQQYTKAWLDEWGRICLAQIQSSKCWLSAAKDALIKCSNTYKRN